MASPLHNAPPQLTIICLCYLLEEACEATATPRMQFLQVYHLYISSTQITKTIKLVHFNLVLSVLTRTGLQEELISNDFTIVPTENMKVNR